MNLFEIVSEELFKPLTWNDKRRYMDILSLLWDTCRRKPVYAVSKTEMIDTVEDYLTGYNEEIMITEGEDGDVPAGNDFRALAAFFLRKLRLAGWLSEREGEYEEDCRIALNHHTIPILKAFAEVVDPKIITYKGKLFKIYSMFSRIDDIENPYENCLKEAEEDLNDLNLSLHQLDASIEGHIDELTTGKTPEEILTFFEKYEERIVVGAYQRFKTNDNLFYYRTGLHEKLDYCEEQFFDVLVRDYAETEHTGEAESRLEIQRLLRSMKDALEEMEDMMRVIDEHHILYRTRAVQRAQFLLLSDGTTKSRIAGLLKYYAADIQNRDDLGAWDDSAVRDVFQVFGQSYFDFSSLAAPVKRRKPTPITEMEDAEELDPEFIDAQNRVLMEYARNALTSDNVNRYAEEILKGRPNATAALVMKQDPSAIIKVIGLYTYSTSPERAYNVRLRNSYVTVGGVRFRDFVIERK